MNKNIWVLFSTILLLSCGNENIHKYRVIIFSDISFQPIIEEEVKVFATSYNAKQTDLVVYYATEAKCLQALQEDSVQGIIIARGLNAQEKAYYKAKNKANPLSIILAYDAVSVIINKHNKDSLLDVSDLKNILVSGRDKNKEWNVVMDGQESTSTSMYLQDSVLKNIPMGKHIQGVSSYSEIINYVENNTNAIGFLGVSWMGNIDDNQQLTFNNRVVTASLLDAIKKDAYVKPYMANIALGRYPLIRTIYFSSKCGQDCPAMDFGRFMMNERGQLIFKRSYLVPAQMSFELKKVILKN